MQQELLHCALLHGAAGVVYVPLPKEGLRGDSEADIKRAEDVVHTYLKKNECDCNYLKAVTLFLDLEKIGAIGYDEAYLQRAKPPIRELLMIMHPQQD